MNAATSGTMARSRSRIAIEAGVLAASLLAGLLGVPLLVWVAGRAVIGPYQNGTGGAGAFLSDFFRGLADGSQACWLLVAGPYAFTLCARLCWRALRSR